MPARPPRANRPPDPDAPALNATNATNATVQLEPAAEHEPAAAAAPAAAAPPAALAGSAKGGAAGVVSTEHIGQAHTHGAPRCARRRPQGWPQSGEQLRASKSDV